MAVIFVLTSSRSQDFGTLVHLLTEINQPYSDSDQDATRIAQSQHMKVEGQPQSKSHFLQTGGTRDHLNLKRIQQFYFSTLDNPCQINVIRYGADCDWVSRKLILLFHDFHCSVFSS